MANREVVTETRTQRDEDDEVVARSRSGDSVPGSVFAGRAVWFVAGVIITFLVVRLILLLLAANQANAFVSFIYSVSAVFAAPFFGIFSYTPSYGGSVFELSTLVAILVYALVAWGLVRLLTLGSRHADEV